MSTTNNRFSPRLETLDERALMSCTVWADNGALTVIGNGGDDLVQVFDDGHGHVMVAATGAGAQAFSGITSILVATYGGNDTVTYRLRDHLVGQQSIEVGLGYGNDSFKAVIEDGVDLLTGSRLSLHALGDELSDPVGGKDALTVLATGVDVRGKLTTALEGGGRGDVIRQRYDGKLIGGKLYMTADGGAGGDTVYQTVKCRTGSSGKVQTMVYGNAGNDTLSLYVYLQPAVEKQLAFLWGGAGYDTLANNATVDAAQ